MTLETKSPPPMQRPRWLDAPILPSIPELRLEHVLFALILLLAVVTRFYDLGSRVMSHDESLHTYFSWLLYRGQGYQHSPMMHGPFQFHIVALTYLLFGVSDFTSRIPSALFSIAFVWCLWYWRKYIGRTGALIAAFLVVISPYMLYYGRYVRNESFAALSGLLMLYAILSYLREAHYSQLFLLAAALALHFVSKETAFIYAAQSLLFLAVFFIARVTRKTWTEGEGLYKAFLISLAVTLLLGTAALAARVLITQQPILTGTETAAPADPAHPLAQPALGALGDQAWPAYLIAAAGVALLASMVFLIRGYTWERVRSERSFALMIVTGMAVLPQLAPFPIRWMEPWLHIALPTSAAEVEALAGNVRAILTIGGTVLILFIVAAAAGAFWDRRRWWQLALTFWIPFVVLYTTVFTNSSGFFTGTVGSLGYWLVQQGVERGSQPWYYYLLVQLPIYEFLPAAGLVLSIFLGFRRSPEPSDTASSGLGGPRSLPSLDSFSLLVFWAISALFAYSFAGEKMPWLTVHITWPMILLTGWALGNLIEHLDWHAWATRRGALAVALVLMLLTSTVAVFVSLTGPIPPFQGMELGQLQATGSFILPTLVALACAAAFAALRAEIELRAVSRLLLLSMFGLMAVLTARSAFRAVYVKYDEATELLVYAHSARAVKDVTEQAEEISRRTTGGMTATIAYDASAPDTGVSWPFVWYLRDFTSLRSFDQPTRSLRDAVVVIADQKNFDKIEGALGPGYYRTDYIRMWWPMQDYFGIPGNRDPEAPLPESYSCRGALGFLRWFKAKDYSRFCDVFTNPKIRAGVLQIWLNRDYTLYAEATGRSDLATSTWQPADQMRLYIRRDAASQIWNYGLGPAKVEQVQDPTEGKYVVLSADRVLGSSSPSDPVFLNSPRQLAVAPDGTLFVADTRNHRILHLDPAGAVLAQWGSFADGLSEPAPPGTFNEPWGIALGSDGSVFVSDTWNHRIQKFTSAGRFLKSWGTYGEGTSPENLYGPRGLAVDAAGRVLVADTGNKRIVVFDDEGNFLMQVGGPGFDAGQFDEPTSIALDAAGRLYVADAWNQRVQTFTPNADGFFQPERQWDVYGWFGQSAENKPYIAVNADGHVFVTDPEGYRVMEFTGLGELVRVWGEYGNTQSTFGLPAGVAVDALGNIWVTDAINNRIMRFAPPI